MESNYIKDSLCRKIPATGCQRPEDHTHRIVGFRRKGSSQSAAVQRLPVLVNIYSSATGTIKFSIAFLIFGWRMIK